MSINDLWMRDVVVKYGLALTVVCFLLFWLTQSWTKIRERTYRDHLLGFESECAELAIPYKQQLFGEIRHIVSSDEILRSMGCVRILEIGVKTGENMQFYPEGTHLIGVDWNRKLGEYLVQGSRSWQFAHVIIEKLIVGDGSSLEDVPEGSVDVVVTTRSLCSVKSIPSTLREISRVLAPGGRYLFMEHVPESEGTFVRWLQGVLTRTGIWPSLFGDCRLDIDFTNELKNAGFKKITWAFLTLEGFVSQPFYLVLSRQHVLGAAIR